MSLMTKATDTCIHKLKRRGLDNGDKNRTVVSEWGYDTITHSFACCTTLNCIWNTVSDCYWVSVYHCYC